MEWRIAILIKQLNNNNYIPAPANPLRTHICEIHPIIWMNAHKMPKICKQKHTYTEIHRTLCMMTKCIKRGKPTNTHTHKNKHHYNMAFYMIFDYAIFLRAIMHKPATKRYRQLFKQLLISAHDEFCFVLIVCIQSGWCGIQCAHTLIAHTLFLFARPIKYTAFMCTYN